MHTHFSITLTITSPRCCTLSSQAPSPKPAAYGRYKPATCKTHPVAQEIFIAPGLSMLLSFFRSTSHFSLISENPILIPSLPSRNCVNPSAILFFLSMLAGFSQRTRRSYLSFFVMRKRRRKNRSPMMPCCTAATEQ